MLFSIALTSPWQISRNKIFFVRHMHSIILSVVDYTPDLSSRKPSYSCRRNFSKDIVECSVIVRTTNNKINLLNK